MLLYFTMTNSIKIEWKILLLLFFAFMGKNTLLVGQIEVEPATISPFEPISLIENVFLGKGIEIKNITFKGIPEAVGFFSNGQQDINLSEGLVMTTGKAFEIMEPNTGGGSGAINQNLDTDVDLESITTGDIFDAVIYEIEFVPFSDTIEFNYVFASEEYPEFGCNCFNDVFGFFLQGPGFPTFQNIGLVPGTNDPVSVRTVHPIDPDGNAGGCVNGGSAPDCGPINEQFYNDNFNNPNWFFDGYTDVFTAKAKVVPCSTYTIKLTIADVKDALYDSAIFFEGRSFGSKVLEVATATLSLDGTIVEGCSDGLVHFSIPSPRNTDLVINYSLVGSAINGTDYDLITQTITIPTGDTLASVIIRAIEDNIPEGLDSVGITVDIDACESKTFWTYIRDNELVAPDLGIDQSICPGDQVQLDGSLNILLIDEKTINSPDNKNYNIPEIQENAPVPPGVNSVVAEIEVIGIQPFELIPAALKEICIILFHSRVDEMDIYLETPNGRFIELTTDNGGDGNDFSTTCFTPTATQSITDITPADAPFKDNYLPEGEWTSIWESGSPTNGSWKLYLKDDQLGIEGVLTNWWITFNPVYQINYQWDAADSISCLDCFDPIVNPTETTQYKITATDSYGCSVSDSITVNINTDIAAPVTICTAVTENSVTFGWTVITGATSYEININNSGWIVPNQSDTTHQITGLAFDETVNAQVRGIGGNCNVAIADVSCTTMLCVAPTPVEENKVNVSCTGRIDGSILVSSDIPDALFVLGTDTNSTGQFFALRAGTYTVFALAANKACDNSIDITIEEPEPLTIGVNEVVPLTCFESNDGLIDVSPNGGTEPYRYNWTSQNNFPDTNVLVNIPAGDYFLSVTDANNCGQTLFIPLPQPEKFIDTLIFQGESCFGGEDGTARLAISGGIGNVNILWSTNEVGNTIDNLAAGNYIVSITDDANCGDTLSFIIDSPPAIGLSSIITEASCSGINDGAATVMAQGGAGNFTFLWNDPLSQTTPTANALTVANYQVIVRDQTGCSDSLEVSVTSPNAIIIDTDLTPVSCFGDQDGVIDLAIAGGSPSYTLNWSDVGILNNQNRNNLSAGAYVVTITDANQCSETIPFSINSPPLIVTNLLTTSANCGLADGTITAETIGGDGSYSYQWNDVQNQTGTTANNLGRGNYSVLITDGTGCTSTASIEVQEEAGIELSISTTPVFCKGDNTGTATVVATGGNGNYLYLWDDSNAQETSTATNLLSGDYMILVLDDNGCESSIPVTIEDRSSLINITFDNQNINCFGEENGAITTSLSGGNPGYNYAWSNGQNSSNLNNIAAGTYLLTITDDKGCQKIDSTIINAPEEFFAEVLVEEISCPGNGDGQIEIIPMGGTAPYEFSLDGNRFSNRSQFGALLPGIYSPAIQDANNCSIPLEQILLEEGEELILSIADINLKSGDPILIKPDVLNGSGTLTFIWSGNNLTDLSCTDCAETLITPTSTQIYNVQVIDENGCDASTRFKVTVEKNRNIYVPTGFSPNNDGVNDRLTVHGPEGTSILFFKIFDRWGELVFASDTFEINDKSAGWDGTYGGRAMNTNVFAWIVEVQYLDGVTDVLKGHSTLIR